METGYRYSEDGKRIPQDIIRFFTCRYNGEEVFRADFIRALVLTLPIIFTTVAVASGTLEFKMGGG